MLTAPTSVEAGAGTATQATVSWDATDGETGYKFERKSGTAWALVVNLGPDVLTRAVTGLKAGTAYLFRVSALSLGGPSAATSAAVRTGIIAHSGFERQQTHLEQRRGRSGIPH